MTQFSVMGRLQGSRCSHHSAPINRERALNLYRKAMRDGNKVKRWSYGSTRVMPLSQNSAKELFSGYSYGEIYLWLSR